MSRRVLPAEPRWITEPTLLAIHAQQIERYGGAHGILDENVVLSALARPVNRWPYDPSPAEVYALTMAMAKNQADDAAVAAYFRDRIKPPA